MDWIDVTEKLPAIGEHVLGYDVFYGRVGEAVLASWEPPHLVFIDSDDCNIVLWTHLPHPDKNLINKVEAKVLPATWGEQ